MRLALPKFGCILLRLLTGAMVAIRLMGIASGQEPMKETLRPPGDGWPPVIGAWFWNDATLEPEGPTMARDSPRVSSSETSLRTINAPAVSGAS